MIDLSDDVSVQFKVRRELVKQLDELAFANYCDRGTIIRHACILLLDHVYDIWIAPPNLKRPSHSDLAASYEQLRISGYR